MDVTSGEMHGREIGLTKVKETHGSDYTGRVESLIKGPFCPGSGKSTGRHTFSLDNRLNLLQSPDRFA